MIKEEFLEAAVKKFGEGGILNRKQIKEIASSIGESDARWFRKGEYKVGYNQYQLPNDTNPKEVVNVVQTDTSSNVAQDNATVNLVMGSDIQNLVPSPFEGFVSWGHHSTIKQVVKSGMFYPIFVTGLSGNGKTLMIEQVHAELNK